jgi:hypothetical protein
MAGTRANRKASTKQSKDEAAAPPVPLHLSPVCVDVLDEPQQQVDPEALADAVTIVPVDPLGAFKDEDEEPLQDDVIGDTAENPIVIGSDEEDEDVDEDEEEDEDEDDESGSGSGSEEDDSDEEDADGPLVAGLYELLCDENGVNITEATLALKDAIDTQNKILYNLIKLLDKKL